MDKPQTSESLSPVCNGTYRVTGACNIRHINLLFVEGPQVILKNPFGASADAKIQIGNFGKADPEIISATGKDLYSLKLTGFYLGKDVFELGVVIGDGAKIITKGKDGISEFDWITEEEAKADTIEAPPCPFKIQPENPGKFIWITGAPGLGKTTSANVLSRDHGYVHYEAGCFISCKNPYVPSDIPDPSLAKNYQRDLIGEGLEERTEVVEKARGMFQQVMDIGREGYDGEVMKNYYEMMCEDIKEGRKRIGGDWAIAAATYKREARDLIR